MADNFSIQTQVQLLAGTTAEVNKTYGCTAAITETFLSTVSLGASASGVSVALGTISAPKMLVVYGAKGVGMRYELTGTLMAANTICVLSDTNGFSWASIYLYNTDSQAHAATVYAAE